MSVPLLSSRHIIICLYCHTRQNWDNPRLHICRWDFLRLPLGCEKFLFSWAFERKIKTYFTFSEDWFSIYMHIHIYIYNIPFTEIFCVCHNRHVWTSNFYPCKLTHSIKMSFAILVGILIKNVNALLGIY